MQTTSLQAYASIADSLGNRQTEVLGALVEMDNATNNEIARFLDLPINQITPRMNELVKKGLVKEIEKRACQVSGRMAIVWGVKYEN